MAGRFREGGESPEGGLQLQKDQKKVIVGETQDPNINNLS